jgi:hypothetical protein
MRMRPRLGDKLRAKGTDKDEEIRVECGYRYARWMTAAETRRV